MNGFTRPGLSLSCECFYLAYFLVTYRPYFSLYFSTVQGGRLVLETIVTSDLLFVQQTKQGGMQWKLTKSSRAKNFKVCQSDLKFLAKKPFVTHPKHCECTRRNKMEAKQKQRTRRKRKTSLRHRKVT